MIKCRIIPELVEIWSAYDTAAENFPDTLEPDSVEGRREIISSALNYIKAVSYTHLTLPTNSRV